MLFNSPGEIDPQCGDVYDYFLQFLRFFLDSLMPKRTSEGQNYGLLYKITHFIKQCSDVRNPNNTKIYKLAELAQVRFILFVILSFCRCCCRCFFSRVKPSHEWYTHTCARTYKQTHT